MTTPGKVYRELGADHFAKHDNPERRKARFIAQFATLGYDVTLTPSRPPDPPHPNPAAAPPPSRPDGRATSSCPNASSLQ